MPSAPWDKAKGRPRETALDLPGGQQRRLCVARAIAADPEILLMDEPASAFHPRSTGRVEDLIGELRSDFTIAILTHNVQQAARGPELTAFVYEGRPVEFCPTKRIFVKPKQKQT